MKLRKKVKLNKKCLKTYIIKEIRKLNSNINKREKRNQE